MQSSSFWKRFIGTVESGDIDDLRRDMILDIGVATFIVGWLLTLAAIGYEGRLEYLPSAFILLAGSTAAPWLRNAHFGGRFSPRPLCLWCRRLQSLSFSKNTQFGASAQPDQVLG